MPILSIRRPLKANWWDIYAHKYMYIYIHAYAYICSQCIGREAINCSILLSKTHSEYSHTWKNYNRSDVYTAVRFLSFRTPPETHRTSQNIIVLGCPPFGHHLTEKRKSFSDHWLLYFLFSQTGWLKKHSRVRERIWMLVQVNIIVWKRS